MKVLMKEGPSPVIVGGVARCRTRRQLPSKREGGPRPALSLLPPSHNLEEDDELSQEGLVQDSRWSATASGAQSATKVGASAPYEARSTLGPKHLRPEAPQATRAMTHKPLSWFNHPSSPLWLSVHPLPLPVPVLHQLPLY
jgi:hypothetical protein